MKAGSTGSMRVDPVMLPLVMHRAGYDESVIASGRALKRKRKKANAAAEGAFDSRRINQG